MPEPPPFWPRWVYGVARELRKPSWWVQTAVITLAVALSRGACDSSELSAAKAEAVKVAQARRRARQYCMAACRGAGYRPLRAAVVADGNETNEGRIECTCVRDHYVASIHSDGEASWTRLP